MPLALLGKQMKGASRRRGAKKRKDGDGADAALLAKIEAAQRADYLRRLAEATKKQLKDKMQREKALTALNRSKVEAAWLRIMRLARVDELRREVEILAQQHERSVDRKDAMLQMLDLDLDKADEQLQVAVRYHLRGIDKLIAIQDERLSDLERRFETDLGSTQDEFRMEKEELIKAHKEEAYALKSILARLEEEQEAARVGARQAHEQAREVCRTATVERIEDLSRQAEDRIYALEGQFQAAHMAYLKHTDTSSERFKELSARDSRTQQELSRGTERIKRLEAELLRLRAKMAANARDFSARNAQLTQERDGMAKHVVSLKGRVQRSRQRAASKMQTLSLAAKDTKADLADRTALAERVLKLAERCRGLETQKEKISPFDTGSSAGEASSAVVARAMEAARKEDVDEEDEDAAMGLRRRVDGRPTTTATRTGGARAGTAGGTTAARGGAGAASGGAGEGKEDGAGAPGMAGDQGIAGLQTHMAEAVLGGEVQALRNFQKRYNRTLAQKLALENERSHLMQENQQLQEIAAQYLEGMSLTERTLEEDNPLLVVNGRAGVDPRVMDDERRKRGPPGGAIDGSLRARNVQVQSMGRGALA